MALIQDSHILILLGSHNTSLAFCYSQCSGDIDELISARCGVHEEAESDT